MPASTHYTPKDPTRDTIAAGAAELARQAARRKQKGLQRANSFSNGERFKLTSTALEAPGPGAYDPAPAKSYSARRLVGKRGDKPRDSSFRSGTRRTLPWGGEGQEAPLSSRSRIKEDVEADAAAAPGPTAAHDDLLPRQFKVKHRPFGSTSPRFNPEPPIDQRTPSPMHYFR